MAIPIEEGFELVVLNPGLILGPMMINAPFASADLVYKLMMGKFPGVPRVHAPWADVRDVAKAHLKAVDCPPNDGYIISQDTIEFITIGGTLHELYGDKKYKIVGKYIPTLVFKFASLISKEVKQFKPFWNKPYVLENTKSVNTLGMKYISLKDCLSDMIPSMIEQGYLPAK